MKVFVTGANGFIGCNLVKKLTKKGHEVTGLVLPGTDPSPIEKSGCRIVWGNILNPEEFSEYLQEVEVVYHLAAKVSDWGKKDEFELINVEGTRRLIEECIKKNVKRFIFMSSLAIHKPGDYIDADETAPRNNYEMPYALSKIKGEDLVMEYEGKGAIEGVIIRPGLFPFGPYDTTSFYHIANAMEKGIYGYISGGKSILSTAYIENLAEGMILAGEKEKAKGEVFVISDNVKITWRELGKMIAEELGVKPPGISIPYSLGMAVAKTLEFLYCIFRIKKPPPLTSYRIMVAGNNYHFISRKAEQLLGYTPFVELREGIKRTIKWYREIRGATPFPI